MGEKVGRIEKEFVLGVLAEHKMPLEVHGKGYQVKGQAVEGDENVITVECETSEGKLFKAKEPVRIYFSYYGHTMMFETTVLQPGEVLILDIPRGLVKNLERKFERIPSPKGVSISFIYEDVSVQLKFPESSEYRELDEPIVFEHFDPVGIESLISQFREKSSEYADKNSIIMFRNREPSSIEEKLMVETGKSIFIPRIDRGLPSSEEYPQQPVVTSDFFPDPTEQEGLFLGMNRQQAQTHFIEKSEQELFSELYCPIIYLKYVIGYVYLANSSKRKRPFTLNILDFALEFSYVLAYSLKESGYFTPEKPEKRQFKAQIINISASGVLFEYPIGELSNEIRVYTDLDLLLHFGKREVKTLGRVMRRYEGTGVIYFGVQFMEMQPEDFRFLFDYVYGRPFSDRDDRLWEGGAAPPKIELD